MARIEDWAMGRSQYRPHIRKENGKWTVVSTPYFDNFSTPQGYDYKQAWAYCDLMNLKEKRNATPR